MTAKKKQSTEQETKNVISIPKKIREILARCPVNELKPIRLARWVDELVTQSRDEGIGDRQIKQWIIDYTKNNYWHHAQIESILTDYGLSSGGGSGGGSSNWGSLRNLEIDDLVRMEENITGLEESELDRADNREQLEKKTRSHMIEFRTKMSEFELNNMIGEVERLKMVIDILLDSLREQKRVIRNSAITQ